MLKRALSGLKTQTPCDTCNGEGRVKTTRERRLTELTDRQLAFLYEAELERKKAEMGTEEDVPDTPDMPNVPAQNPGGPPIRGNTKQF